MIKNKKHFKLYRTLLTVATASLFAVALTGCGKKLQNFSETELPQMFKQRVEENRKIANALHEAKFLSDAEMNSINKRLDDVSDKYGSTGKSDSMKDLAGAVVRLHTYSGEGKPLNGKDGEGIVNQVDGAYVAVDKDTMKEILASNYMMYSGQNPFQNWSVGSNITDVPLHNNSPMKYVNADAYGEEFVRKSDTDKDIVPIPILEDLKEDNKLANDINSRFEAPIYILRPNLNNTASAADSSLDGTLEAIKKAIDENDFTGLSNYFIPLTDENGDNITLFDFTLQPDKKIVRATKDVWSTYQTDGSVGNICGQDMVIQEDNLNIFSVRLVEFAQDAVDNLFSTKASMEEGGTGNDDDNQLASKFVWIGNTETNTAQGLFLVEYPISVVSSMTAVDDDNIAVRFKSSGIGINIYTKDMVKYEGLADTIKGDGVNDATWSKVRSHTVEVDEDEQYLTIASAANQDEVSLSSFATFGVEELILPLTKFGGAKDVSGVATGRIVLRDYLEATYAPGFVNDEKLVAFGRKLRLDTSNNYIVTDPDVDKEYKFDSGDFHQEMLKYPKDAEIAEFVDINGKVIPTTATLKPTDFVDNELLLKKTPVCESIVPKGQEPSDIPFNEDTVDFNKIDELEQKTVGTGVVITPTSMFPSERIGKVDASIKDNPSQQRFYCLTTKYGIFGSDLFSSWINSSSTSASVSWWNGYLSDNHFSYQIGEQELSEYLSNNYPYELTQNDIVVLDLDTVAAIQKMYDKDSTQKKVDYFNTFCKVLGWLLVAYAFLMLLCWIIDTQLDIGLKLLNKITFGHWYAVIYEDDLAGMDQPNGIRYVTRRNVFFYCFILITIGLLLIMLNMSAIMLSIFRLFGGLAAKIEELIRGSR